METDDLRENRTVYIAQITMSRRFPSLVTRERRDRRGGAAEKEDGIENLPLLTITQRKDIRPNLTLLFNYCNERYFNNEIKGYTVRYSTNLTQYGYTSKHEKIINISWKIHGALRQDSFATLMGTLLHEMVHAWLYLYDDRDAEQEQHGAVFQRKLKQIADKARGKGYHIVTTPRVVERDAEKAVQRYGWRCAVCRAEKSVAVKRDINGDYVLSAHPCSDSDAKNSRTWLRVPRYTWERYD